MISGKAKYFVATLSFLVHISYSQIHLVKDGNPGYDSSFVGVPENLTPFGNGILFSSHYDVPGNVRNLWKSDGVYQREIKDFTSAEGTDLGIADTHGSMVKLNNGQVIFVANDGVHGFELWITDGTSAGTKLIRDIFSGSSGSNPKDIQVLGGAAYFSADDGVHGRELWKSDGTMSGTELLVDINPGSADSNPNNITTLSSSIVFSAKDIDHGNEPWMSEGTPETTHLLKDIEPGSSDSYSYRFIGSATDFYIIGNSLIWKSNATANGTVSIPGTESAGEPACVFNGRLYFTSSIERRLLSTNGVSVDVEQVASVNEGFEMGADMLTVADGNLYYGYAYRSLTENDPGYRNTFMYVYRLNISNGSYDYFYSTEWFEDLNGPEETFWGGPVNVFKYEDKLYLRYATLQFGTVVTEIGTGNTWGTPYIDEVVINDKMFYSTTRNYPGPSYDPELWHWDGTTKYQLTNNYVAKSSWISDMAPFQDGIFFHSTPADDNFDGRGYITDGLSVSEVTEDSVSWSVTCKDEIYYVKFILEGELFQLWKSDGTPEGNVFIKSFGYVDYLVASGNSVYILAYTFEHRHELWKIDASMASPLLLKQFDDFVVFPLISIHDKLWFRVGNESRLWQSDGSETGTFAFGNFECNGENYADFVVEFEGALYFGVLNESGAHDIYKSDGSPEGTSLILKGSDLGLLYLTHLFVSSDFLYVVGQSESLEDRLIAFDGTNFETVFDGSIFMLAAGDNFASFLHYEELWTTSGTLASTQIVASNAKHISTGVNLGIYGDTGYFVGYDESHGHELWETDGTAEGTKLFLDIEPGPISSYPGQIFIENAMMYFVATTIAHGRELYSYGADLTMGTESERISSSLYPNPSTGSVIITTNSAIENVVAFDLAGNVIPSDFVLASVHDARVNVHAVDGLFIVQIKTKMGLVQKKLVIKR